MGLVRVFLSKTSSGDSSDARPGELAYEVPSLPSAAPPWMVLALSLDDLGVSGGSKRVSDLMGCSTGRSLFTDEGCRAMTN